jgi:hypothetical protein
MFECKDVAEEASNYLNKDLPWRKRLGLWLHLMYCSCCRNYLQQMKQAISAFTTLRPQEKSDTDTKSLAAKLRELNQENHHHH